MTVFKIDLAIQIPLLFYMNLYEFYRIWEEGQGSRAEGP